MKKISGFRYFYLFVVFLAAPSLLYPLLYGCLDTQNHENRVLAEAPVLSVENYDKITAQAESFYNDRLPFKNQLVRVHSFLEGRVNFYPSTLEMIEGTETVTRGKDGWLFYTVRTEEENSVADYLGVNRYTGEELKALADGYERFAAYLSAYGGQAVLFCPPNKENVYPQYMPDRLKQGTEGNRLEEALAYLSVHTPVTVVFPKEELLSDKSGYPLYYKYDTHWNRLGAFVGYQELKRALQGQGSRLSDQTVVTYGSKEGDLSRLLGTASQDTDDPEYAVADYRPEVSVTRTAGELAGGSYEEYAAVCADSGSIAAGPSGNGRTGDGYTGNGFSGLDERSVLLFRDSFGAAMLDYLPKDFAKVWVTESEETAAALIREKKPDLVILEIVERRAACLETAEVNLTGPEAVK